MGDGTAKISIQRRGTTFVHFCFLLDFSFLFLDAQIRLSLLTFIVLSSLIRGIFCTLCETSTYSHLSLVQG